jgi:uncharacterized protein (TIGR02466 family)
MVIDKQLSLVFPTPIGIVQFDNMALFDAMAVEVLKIKDSSTSTIFQEIGTFCTDDNLNNLVEFEELAKLIDDEVQIYIQDAYKMDPDHVTMTGMWSNVHNSKAKHHVHMHPNSFLSGVIYLSTPDANDDYPGNIFFLDPRYANRFQRADYKESTVYNENNWVFKPQKGMMLLFPGWLEHGTDAGKFSNDQYRISLSFNYVLNQASEVTCKFNFNQN